jgi:aminoglycoside phosphotransferase (APT) family kinase protein
MQPTNQQLLQAIRTGLGRLMNEATGSRALIANLDIAVGELLARSGDRRESLEKSYLEARALAYRGSALLQRAGDCSFAHRAEALPPGPGLDLQAAEASYRQAQALLTDCVLRVSAAASNFERPPEWSNAVRRFYLDLASLEGRRAVDDFVPAPDIAVVPGATIDFSRIKTYFQRWPGKPRPLELQEARILSGGFSRETFLVTLRDQSGSAISLVLRKQLPGGLLGSSCLKLSGEVHFLNLAHAAGLPVAEVYWHETDESILGGEFIVMACLRGTTLGSSIAASVVVDEALLRDLAHLLARLHQIDWAPAAAALCSLSGLPPSRKVTAVEAANAVCAAFETMWREANLDPLPTLELILDWLKRNVPTTDRLAMISHGDIGFHNLMGSDGRITGLIDWETARLADPAKDIAMVQALVVNHVPWHRFMGWYQDAGGPEIDDASLSYYSIYHAFTHLLVCEVAIGSRFSQTSTPALEYLQLGFPFRAFFAKELLRDCDPIWRAKL